MKKKTYVLNRSSSWHTVTIERFDHNINQLDASDNIKGLLSTRENYLQKNSRDKSLRISKSHTNKIGTHWDKTIVWKREKLIRLFSALILLCIGLFFQFNEHGSSALASFLYLVSIAIGGYRLLLTGLNNLLALHIDMRTMMIFPLVGVILLGRWLEGAIFVLLFTINEALETHSINIAKQSMQRVFSLAPKTATVQVEDQLVSMNVSEVNVNEIIIVDVGEQIPLDGRIVAGETFVNEEIFSGYANSMFKSVGDEVFAGCVNIKEKIFVEVTKEAHESKIAHVISSVEKAQKKQAPAQHFIENLMVYYTPLIILLAILIAILPPLVAGAHWDEWIYLALAVLVTACPCSLIISTPIAFITGLSNAANSGILLKDATSIEELSRIKGVAFDQIGTLTVGNPIIKNIVSLATDEASLIQLGASISSCNHPFGKAIVNLAEERNIPPKKVLQFKTIAGKGAYGIIDGTMYTIGSSELLNEGHEIEEHIWEKIDQFQLAGKTVVTVSTANELIGFFTLQDEVRPEAKSMIAGLKKEGVKHLFLMTEDNEYVANQLAQKLNIDHIFKYLQPDFKSTKINKLRHLYSHIAFVSSRDEKDEENLFSQASVNITNSGNINEDVLENREVVFLQENLTKLPALIHFSKKTIRIVKYNIFIVFLLKITALLLVIPGILTLWMAIVFDIIATLVILFNTIRLTD